MTTRRLGVCFRAGSACRGAVAVLLIAAITIGVLPYSVEQPLLPGGEKACRFEPIDVCGAGDSSLGMIADTPVLLAEVVAVVIPKESFPAPPSDEGSLLEGFAPGVYRPPRLSC
jgi:hypothetical protein